MCNQDRPDVPYQIILTNCKIRKCSPKHTDPKNCWSTGDLTFQPTWDGIHQRSCKNPICKQKLSLRLG